MGDGQGVTVEPPFSLHSDSEAVLLQAKRATFIFKTASAALSGDIRLLAIELLLWVIDLDRIGLRVRCSWVMRQG